jgi:hypothetical protein
MGDLTLEADDRKVVTRPLRSCRYTGSEPDPSTEITDSNGMNAQRVIIANGFDITLSDPAKLQAR